MSYIVDVFKFCRLLNLSAIGHLEMWLLYIQVMCTTL